MLRLKFTLVTNENCLKTVEIKWKTDNDSKK